MQRCELRAGCIVTVIAQVSHLNTQLEEASRLLRMEKQKSGGLESEIQQMHMELKQTEACADDLRAGEEAAAKIYHQVTYLDR